MARRIRLEQQHTQGDNTATTFTDVQLRKRMNARLKIASLPEMCQMWQLLEEWEDDTLVNSMLSWAMTPIHDVTSKEV